MANLMDVSAQWSSRPDDERFLSLPKLAAHCRAQREASRGLVVRTRDLEVRPWGDSHRDLAVVVAGVEEVAGRSLQAVTRPSHWSFGQLAALAGAPAGYLRELPAEVASDCLNWGLLNRPSEDVGVLVRRELIPGHTPAAGSSGLTLAAATGPRYGRVWNSDVADALVARFGDGVAGHFRVPGVMGKAAEVTCESTTLYAGDRDMFVFLANEERRVEVPNRRGGQPGSLARGFLVWNSEVGSAVLGVKTFLFDYVCGNRIVWGAQDIREVRVRHTGGAPERFLREVQPALEAFSGASGAGVAAAVAAARARRLGDDPAAVDAFLAARFGRSVAKAAQVAHLAEEGRPVETVWDAVVGVTAYARGIPNQGARVEVEERAGDLMGVAA